MNLVYSPVDIDTTSLHVSFLILWGQILQPTLLLSVVNLEATGQPQSRKMNIQMETKFYPRNFHYEKH